MAFLLINNHEIPVVAGGQLSTQEIGSSGRVYTGGFLRNRRALKRRWRFRTPILPAAKANAIIGMLNGRGHFWDFDGTTTDPITTATNALTVSGSGLIPSTLTGCTIHSNTGDNSDSVANVYTAPATTGNAAARTQALGIYRASNNELSEHLRDCENDPANDFTAVNGATLATETTEFFQTAKSLKITTAGADEGASGTNIGAAAAEVWTGSVYLLGASGGESVKIEVFDDNSGATPETFTLSATEWRRVWVTHTVVAGASNVNVRVVAASGTPVFYADCWQLEEKAYPTAWYDGDRSSADEAEYDGSWLQGAPGVSVSMWTNGSAGADIGSVTGGLIAYGVDTTERYIVFIDPTTGGKLKHAVYYDGSAEDSEDLNSTMTYGQWAHIVSVWDVDGGTFKVYRDGALIGTSISPTNFKTSDIETISLGHTYASPLDGELDDVLVVPYAMDTTMITSLYNSGTVPTIGNHGLIASGDFIPDTNVTVYGFVNNATYQFAQQTTWQTNNRVVDFTLEEA